MRYKSGLKWDGRLIYGAKDARRKF